MEVAGRKDEDRAVEFAETEEDIDVLRSSLLDLTRLFHVGPIISQFESLHCMYVYIYIYNTLTLW